MCGQHSTQAAVITGWQQHPFKLSDCQIRRQARPTTSPQQARLSTLARYSLLIRIIIAVSECSPARPLHQPAECSLVCRASPRASPRRGRPVTPAIIVPGHPPPLPGLWKCALHTKGKDPLFSHPLHRFGTTGKNFVTKSKKSMYKLVRFSCFWPLLAFMVCSLISCIFPLLVLAGHSTLGREKRLHCSEISDRYLLPVSTEIHRSSDLHRHEQWNLAKVGQLGAGAASTHFHSRTHTVLVFLNGKSLLDFMISSVSDKFLWFRLVTDVPGRFGRNV